MPNLKDELHNKLTKPTAQRIIDYVFDEYKGKLQIENYEQFVLVIGACCGAFAEVNLTKEFRRYQEREKPVDSRKSLVSLTKKPMNTKQTLITLMMLGQTFQKEEGK